MEGLNRSIYEIFEIVLPILFLLVIGTTIIIVSDPNYSNTYATSTEISKIASMISNEENVVLEFKYPIENFKVTSENNKVTVQIEDSKEQSVDYIGNKVKITQNKNIVTIENG